MAHLTDAISWDILAANLVYYSPEHPLKPPAKDLYFRPSTNLKKDVEAFADSFSRAIAAHTSTERRKYPESYEPPDGDDLILDDDTAGKISPTVVRWRPYCLLLETTYPETPRVQSCQHHGHENDRFVVRYHNIPYRCSCGDGFRFDCECALPLRERKAHAFSRQLHDNDCHEFDSVNGAVFFNLEVVKTLLVHGEMDPVLRVCAHPDVPYRDCQTLGECDCDCCCVEGNDLGWDHLYRPALEAYIVLNALYCFPELASGPQPDVQEEHNYRDTRVYQRMLHSCTKFTGSEVTAYLHRQFFGIADDQFGKYFDPRPGLERAAIDRIIKNTHEPRDSVSEYLGTVSTMISPSERGNEPSFPYGKLPFDLMLSCEEEPPYFLHASEVIEAIRALRLKKLPEELVCQIIDSAGYDGPQRQLPVAHDPFHLENRSELERYLSDCWNTIVRCNVFAQALGTQIDWKDEVTYCLSRQFSGLGKKRLNIWDKISPPGSYRDSWRRRGAA